ncbi:MAG TPA: RDD family protein [Candidatus Limnocylindria bacterium]
MAAATAMAVTGDKIGFWRRFAAIIVDAVLLGIVNQILVSMAGGDPTQSSGLGILVGIAYFVGLWTYWDGQTIGNKALGIKVVKTDGKALDLVSSVIRYVGLIISCIALFIGVIWVAFDANKQGWHDKMANTYVVKA